MPSSADVEPAPLERLPDEWEGVLSRWNEPRYRALQIFHWIHRRGVADPMAMTDLPLSLRQRLREDGLGPGLSLAESLQSVDGTRKLLVQMHDAQRVETVLIPRGAVAAEDIYAPDASDDAGSRQYTQCVSSQVGCAMGCVFCASGVAGLKRQMSSAEIISQVLLGRQVLGEEAQLSGVVFMGMGEPLHNYAALARALRLLNHPEGIGMSLRRVTVSTSGLVPELDRLAADFGGQVQLAVSIHSASQDRRSELMPINRRYPLARLLDALKRYPLPPGRRITIEYTLIDAVNSSEADAHALVRALSGLRVKVNLIPLNDVVDSPLRRPGAVAVDAFQHVLELAGVPSFVRRRKGDDIAAACGQLALRGEPRRVRLPS